MNPVMKLGTAKSAKLPLPEGTIVRYRGARSMFGLVGKDHVCLDGGSTTLCGINVPLGKGWKRSTPNVLYKDYACARCYARLERK